jgi:hypothetical protein
MGSGCGLSTGGHDSFPSEIPPKREEPLIYCLLSKNQGHELTEAAVADQRTFCEDLSGVWSIREMILRPSRNHHKSRLWVKVRIYFLFGPWQKFVESSKRLFRRTRAKPKNKETYHASLPAIVEFRPQ